MEKSGGICLGGISAEVREIKVGVSGIDLISRGFCEEADWRGFDARELWRSDDLRPWSIKEKIHNVGWGACFFLSKFCSWRGMIFLRVYLDGQVWDKGTICMEICEFFSILWLSSRTRWVHHFYFWEIEVWIFAHRVSTIQPNIRTFSRRVDYWEWQNWMSFEVWRSELIRIHQKSTDLLLETDFFSEYFQIVQFNTIFVCYDFILAFRWHTILTKSLPYTYWQGIPVL